jgi:hypothetical protein
VSKQSGESHGKVTCMGCRRACCCPCAAILLSLSLKRRICEGISLLFEFNVGENSGGTYRGSDATSSRRTTSYVWTQPQHWLLSGYGGNDGDNTRGVMRRFISSVPHSKDSQPRQSNLILERCSRCDGCVRDDHDGLRVTGGGSSILYCSSA